MRKHRVEYKHDGCIGLVYSLKQAMEFGHTSKKISPFNWRYFFFQSTIFIEQGIGNNFEIATLLQPFVCFEDNFILDIRSKVTDFLFLLLKKFTEIIELGIQIEL